MNKTAYLLAWLETTSGTLVFKSLHIFSEANPTCMMNRGMYMNIYQASGNDFEHASYNLMIRIRDLPYLAWCKNHLRFPAPHQNVKVFSKEGMAELERRRRVLLARTNETPSIPRPAR